MTGRVASGASVTEHLTVCGQCAELFDDSAELGRRLASVGCETPRSASLQLAEIEALIARERGLRAFLRSRSTRSRWALSLCLPGLLLARELVSCPPGYNRSERSASSKSAGAGSVEARYCFDPLLILHAAAQGPCRVPTVVPRLQRDVGDKTPMRQRVPWRELSVSRMVGVLFLLGLFGLVANSALRPLPIERRAAQLRAALAVVAWCLPCVLWLAPEAQASADDFSGAFAWRALACFAYGSALAAPSFALLWAMDRGVRVPFRVWALAAGGVALLANLLLMLHCPITNRAHLVAGHFSIGLAWFAAVTTAEWWRRRVA